MTIADKGFNSPTLHDVARTAGVSLATASRVLNGSTRKVAESYRERVQAAARELGYTPNLSAQATARGTSNTVALLVADIADPYFGLIAQGIARQLEEAGLLMTMAITLRDPDHELEIVRALRGQRPRGVILAASRNPVLDRPDLYAELDALHSRGARIVTFGSAGASRTARVVAPDNHNGALQLGKAMGELGYRDALMIAAERGPIVSDNRIAGFSEGFRAAGGNEPRIHRRGMDWNAGYDGMTEELKNGVEPGTLVVGITDVTAIGAMNAIREAGREPGTDIAVCGTDNIPTSRDMWPSLTTVHLSLQELGRRALAAVTEDEWTRPDPMPAQVILRASTPGLR